MYATPSTPYEKSKSLGSGRTMVARLELKGEALQRTVLQTLSLRGRGSLNKVSVGEALYLYTCSIFVLYVLYFFYNFYIF